MILAIGDLLIFIAATFVGDHSIGSSSFSLPSFLLVWTVLIVYRIITGLDIQNNELKLQQILFIIFIPYIVFGIFRSDTYYYAFMQIILYINAFPILYRLINNRYTMPVIVVFFSLMAVAAVMFSGGNRLKSNETFIFGPNIMYRIYGALFFIFFYTVIKNLKRRGPLLIAVFMLSFICMISTGSRGALVLILLESLFVIYYFRKNPYIKYFTYIVIASIVYNIVQYWDIINPLLGRAVYFDTNNASENTRISMYGQFFKFLNDESPLPMLFGLGNNNSYYPHSYYPHNIVIESVVYHGLVFFGILIAASTELFRKLKDKDEIRYFVLIFFPIILGSMLSGSFQDNYPVISLVFYCYLNHFKMKKQVYDRHIQLH